MNARHKAITTTPLPIMRYAAFCDCRRGLIPPPGEFERPAEEKSVPYAGILILAVLGASAFLYGVFMR